MKKYNIIIGLIILRFFGIPLLIGVFFISIGICFILYSPLGGIISITGIISIIEGALIILLFFRSIISAERIRNMIEFLKDRELYDEFKELMKLGDKMEEAE